MMNVLVFLEHGSGLANPPAREPDSKDGGGE